MATLFSSLLNFVLVYILTRNMSTSSFGLVITALTFTQLVTDIGEFGINPASLNFVTKETDKVNKLKLAKASLILKLLVAFIISLIVLVTAPLISIFIFKNEMMIPLIAISSFGIFISMGLVWGQVMLQAERNFFWVALVNLSPNLFRVLLILTILVFYSLNYLTAYLTLNLVLLLSALLALYKIGFGFLKTQTRVSDYKKIIKLGLPIGIGFAIAAIYTRLDQLTVFNILGEREAGVYGLASRLSSFFIFASVAVISAVTPRIASLEKHKFDKYFRKVVLLSIGLAFLCLFSILFSPLILSIFGSEYVFSIVPFSIQLVGVAFFAVSAPFTTVILFRFNKSGYSLWLSLASLIVITLLLFQLVPLYGGVGAAFSLALIYLLQLISSFVYYLFLSNRYATKTEN